MVNKKNNQGRRECRRRWVFAFVWVGLLAGCSQAMFPGEIGSPAPAQTETAAGTVVYTSNPNGNWDIYSVTTDGRHAQRLTSTPAEEEGLMPSPDGTKITFVSKRDGDYEIYVMNLDGTKQQRLTHARGIDEDPYWFPDGSKILFESAREGNWDVFVMNADGTNPINLTRTPVDEADPILSPDGTRILFKSLRDGSWRLYAMNVDGSGLTSLVRSDYTEGANDDPVWSPDGRRVAFVSHRDGNSGIYIMDLSATAAGSSPPDFRTINRHPDGDEGPVWSPDGSQIAFVSGRDGSRKIYVVDHDQSMPVPVSSVPVERGVPQWSPDGRWIAYIAGPPENRVIHLVNPGSQAHQELKHAKGEIAELRWVPAETPVRVGRRSER